MASEADSKTGGGGGGSTFRPFIPEGYGQPDYIATTIGPQVLGAQIGLAVVAVFLVGLRVYTRACIRRAFGWDDWCIIISTALVIALVSVHGVLVRDCGLGYHLIDQMARYRGVQQKATLLGYVASIIHVVAMFFIKLSILIFLYRLITVGRTRIVLKATTFIVVAFTLVWLFLLIFKCNPPQVFWESKIYTESGKCRSHNVAHIVLPIGSAITDIMVWALPMPAIFRLQLALREKIAVVILFCIGSGSFVASFVRAGVFVEARMIDNAPRAIAIVSICSSVEALAGIICACLFTLKPLFDHPKLLGSIFSSRASRSKGSKISGGSGSSASLGKMENYSSNDEQSKPGLREKGNNNMEEDEKAIV